MSAHYAWPPSAIRSKLCSGVSKLGQLGPKPFASCEAVDAPLRQL